MGKTSQNGDYTIYIKIKSLQKLTKVTWNHYLAYQITVEIHLLVQKKLWYLEIRHSLFCISFVLLL